MKSTATPMSADKTISRPLSFYRLQLTPSFDFSAAVGLLDYLESLGVSHLYLSPILEARAGSQHGYDVTDPTRIREELGGESGFEALSDAARERGMGILIDIVPNHMAASPQCKRWMDILADGAASPWSHWFDINWKSRGRPGALETHVLMPILGGPYGSVLESGELKLAYEEGAFYVDYYDWRLPLTPRSWHLVLEPGLGVKAATLGADHPAVKGLEEIFALTSKMPPWTATHPDERAERQRTVKQARELFARLVSEVPEVEEQMRQNLEAIAGTPGEPESFDRLDGVLSVQPYRLCFWKLATERVSYRRFFDIGSLVGVRVEDRRVFRETHERVIKLLRDGRIHGLRLDHIDGLLDPRGYLRRLRRAAGRRAYIVAEKILAADEELPGDWAVQGTTGYEASHVISGPFVDERGLARMARSWAAVPGAIGSFADLVHRSKLRVLETLFGGELQAVISDAVLAVERDRHGRDISPRQIGDALLEVTAALSVYRTYVRGREMSETDKQRVRDAVSAARRRNPTVDRYAFDMVERLLTLSWPHSLTPPARRNWSRVVQRWQQLTGPAMAKGLEDTALYVDARLIGLNEVGADEETIEHPADVQRLHDFVSRRRERWPQAMNNSSTHDSKRSEDARARLLVLSEMAAEWDAAIARWNRWHRRLERDVGGRRVPDQAVARFVYQTLLCVWPLEPAKLPSVKDRVLEYLRKAAREAKVHSSWIESNEAYEEALLEFAADLCDPRLAPRYQENMSEMAPKVAFFGALNSLSMTLLKLTLPGVPDIYQGNELWRMDLADPDNRRPVDFEERRSALAMIDQESEIDPEASIRRLLDSWPDGRVKLFLLARVLRHRRRNESLWLDSDYQPLRTAGGQRGHLIAFARRGGSKWIISVVPRLCMRLTETGRFPLGEEVWGRTVVRLPSEVPTAFRDILTGRTIFAGEGRRGMELSASEMLSSFPGAVLESE